MLVAFGWRWLIPFERRFDSLPDALRVLWSDLAISRTGQGYRFEKSGGIDGHFIQALMW